MLNENTDTNTTKSDISTLIGRLLGIIFVFFIGPLMMMYGWNAVAWHCNLPTFGYWQVFCICNGIRWFLKDITPFR